MNDFVEHAAAGVAILLWATDPAQPQTLFTPFHHAVAAAAIELPVEIYFSARSVQLLLPGVADGIASAVQPARTVGQAMREAHELGVRLWVCSDALQAQGLQGRALIPECAGHGGALQFMLRAADLRWRTLVF